MPRFASRYDALVAAPSLAGLWGGSDRFNVGWWRDGARSVAAASDALATRLAARLPPGGRRLEVACGARPAGGDGTAALSVVCDLSLARLARAAPHAPGRALAADAVRLPFRAGAFDALLAIEAAFHFDRRIDFFAEAVRLLAPGGTLVLSDFLVRDAEALGGWLVPAENRGGGLAAYRAELAAAGFAEIDVEDATGDCWRGFCAALAARAGAAQTGPVEAAVEAYVITVARRPA